MRAECLRRWVYGIIVLALWGGVMLSGGQLAHAQDDDDEEQDTGVILATRAEVLFPVAVRFVVAVRSPLDQVEAATLTVHQESGVDLAFTVEPEQHLLKDGGIFVDLIYTWDLTAGVVPVPFEPLAYRWQVETREEGESVATGELLFEDRLHSDWQSAGQPPLILHWMSESLAGRTIREEVLAAYDLLNRRAGLAPLFQFVIYDPGVRLCLEVEDPASVETRSVLISREDKAEFPCSVATFEDFYARAGMIFLQRDTFGYTELQDQLVTEMVRRSLDDWWEGAQVPAWFASGLAQLHHLRAQPMALELVRAAVRTGSHYALAELADDLPSEADYQARALWEAQSYLLVLYLADRYGAGAPFDLAQNIPADDDGFAGALAALGGEDVDALWAGWNRWLFSPAAENAAGWTPYLLTTPTPTATPTATPLPPTATATHTPTITPTPTSTALVDQPRPPVVAQLTPTRRRPPTNTPLPPGSLPTVTSAAPERADGPDSGLSDGAMAGVIGAVVVAVLLIASGLVMMARRR